jgi:NAD-dependent DNA ligase
MTWAEARIYYYQNRERWISSKPTDSRSTVCFSGFTTGEKDALVKLAEEKNLRVVGSVTRDLQLLVCGPNAGPKKLEKASAQGVAIISEEDFREYKES